MNQEQEWKGIKPYESGTEKLQEKKIGIYMLNYRQIVGDIYDSQQILFLLIHKRSNIDMSSKVEGKA